ncbi:MAG: hypothetical protein ACT4OJ_04900 [Bacteroidota bacterium]
MEQSMTHFSTTYRGFTITLLAGYYRIATLPYVHFLTLQAAKNYIDKIRP